MELAPLQQLLLHPLAYFCMSAKTVETHSDVVIMACKQIQSQTTMIHRVQASESKTPGCIAVLMCSGMTC